jgi:hypothetical protein
LNRRFQEPNAVLQRTKEHCLMGIKGTVRRSTDGDFIHANVYAGQFCPNGFVRIIF